MDYCLTSRRILFLNCNGHADTLQRDDSKPLRIGHGPVSPTVTIAGVRNNICEVQGQRNTKSFMQMLGDKAIQA
ncbi:hypothetical protein [Burkholderia gladioli]|uniref:hypothetical protein n=1 Tax=Burkholderia gladioli TaxID=28095 RepID=UPI001640F225|nr:hypothetical protein [Burkholderia gladioli]